MLGQCQLDIDRRTLSHNDRVIPLTPREVALLENLYRRAPDCVTHDMLLRDAWHYHPDVRTNAVRTTIYRLRRKIEAAGSFPTVLIHDGRGYCLALGDWQGFRRPQNIKKIIAK